ncbi:MAG: response regulator [Bacteroidota bacterium]
MNKKFSILYVDDEESNLRIFKNTFRREYDVYTVTNAKDGIEILKKEDIDIILSDQRMPEMTGVEFFKHTLEAHPQLNRILITGFTDFNALQSAINDAKIFQYIQKPWQEGDLRTIIEKALRVYKLEQENKELTVELKEKNKSLVKINKELKSSNEKLIVAKNKAEESDRLKSVFFANISHEIRTPMNGIIGFTKILNEQDLSDEQRQEFGDIIIRSSEQLMHIIDDIMEVSHLATSNVKLNLGEVDLNRFLDDLIAVYENESNDKVSIQLINELSEKDGNIMSDALKLKKILNNLIDNALKYTSEGYVKVSCKKNNSNIEFCIEDSGIGINPEMQHVIFDRFRQEEESSTRQFGGLGLGLSIVKENVTLLSGKIWVKSEKGKGSTFTFTIPYAPAGETTIITDKGISNESSSSVKNKHTILIVEDEVINSLYLETLLEDMDVNLKILNAENGQEAVDCCRENVDIDLVLMDIKMPIMNGIEATQEIRKFRKNLPIVAQTAYTTNEDREKAKQAGCDDFITKPIEVNILSDLIARYLVVVKE